MADLQAYINSLPDDQTVKITLIHEDGLTEEREAKASELKAGLRVTPRKTKAVTSND